ncbi:unnamed protein product [Phytophthora fragariaefolia]|uniref:Unnamed protein product n=1 Tax=Phytophthora fragariaefolia TaxID=1490495 RepID=A0A9W6Y7W4_9STRA|nr:unnamed protein product [Phytophthora fragariaefolia]
MHLSSLFFYVATAMTGASAGLTHSEQAQPILFAATWTTDPAQGVYTYKFNTTDGSLTQWAITPFLIGTGGINPTYLQEAAVKRNDGKRLIYGLNRATGDGYVSAMTLNANGTLDILNTQQMQGGSPAHVTLSPNEDFIAVANYAGSLSLFPLYENGTVAPETYYEAFPNGSHVVMTQQATGHIHSTRWLPNSSHVVAANLGGDTLLEYQLDVDGQTLIRLDTVYRPPGSGPCRSVLSANGDFLYVTNEISNAVGVTAADIHLSKNGKFVYVSNRGHNSIAIYAINDADSTLTPLGWESTRGQTPRGFTVYEDWLIVANQNSNDMYVQGGRAHGAAVLHRQLRGLESLRGIKGEWELSTSRAWKGPGSIAGTKAHVGSIYQHKEAGAPTPGDALHHGHNHSHEHSHSHGHGHSHTHSHSHGHEDTHDHHDDHGAAEVEGEAVSVEMSHDHSHDHEHGHDHEPEPAHAFGGEEKHEDEPMRNLDDIKALIAESELSDWAKEKSIAVFSLLAQAEAHTHGTSLEEIHFHEVGAIDSIIDTIGSVIALDLLGVREVHASFLPFSSGTVKCMHGVLPVPPPATFRLMIGVPVCPAPKGLVKALASTFGEPPAFIPTHTGVGAGTKDFPEHANIVRVAIGKKIDPMATEKSYVNPAASRSAEPASCPYATEKVVVLETNLDDLNPQVIGYVSELLLLEHHALDVWKQPIQMKKNRPGVCLSTNKRF